MATLLQQLGTDDCPHLLLPDVGRIEVDAVAPRVDVTEILRDLIVDLNAAAIAVQRDPRSVSKWVLGRSTQRGRYRSCILQYQGPRACPEIIHLKAIDVFHKLTIATALVKQTGDRTPLTNSDPVMLVLDHARLYTCAWRT